MFKNEAVFSIFIKPICLPKIAGANELKRGFIVGWGQAIAERNTEKVMQKSQLDVPLSNEECLEVGREYISNRTFCAKNKLTSACRGDSGDNLLKSSFLQGFIFFQAVDLLLITKTSGTFKDYFHHFLIME